MVLDADTEPSVGQHGPEQRRTRLVRFTAILTRPGDGVWARLPPRRQGGGLPLRWARAPHCPAAHPQRHSRHPIAKEAHRMSTLVAIAYPDAATAEQVRAELVQATKEHILQLEDAVVVEHRSDGKIKLHQAVSPSGAGAAGGAMWGGLIGLLFLAPLFGMAIGAASGAF